jgi:hypothetical protein
MIENMIQSLYNIAPSSIGSTWWPMAMHPSGIRFGVMHVIHNLRVQSHGFLSASIQTLFKDVRCYGASLEVDMAKAPMMVLEQSSRGFYKGNNLMLMGQNSKTQKRWWTFYTNICQIDLRHHKLV